jgi:hypothetical protein
MQASDEEAGSPPGSPRPSGQQASSASALFAAWLVSERHSEWRVLQWVGACAL